VSSFDPQAYQLPKLRTPMANPNIQTYFSDKFIQTSKKQETAPKKISPKSTHFHPKPKPHLHSSTKFITPLPSPPPLTLKTPNSFTLPKGGLPNFPYKKKSDFAYNLSKSLGPKDFHKSTAILPRKDIKNISNIREIFE
jgi:hypothetical protein